MNFNENFEKYLSRLQKMKSQIAELSEESTKTSLVMPFFSMLGYDVFDTTEFMPEFTCDVATKKGEKVDYAILKDGEPAILIEVKRAGMKLQKQQIGQLYRYFSTNRCRIAILTNGIIYHFFSDLNAPNIMDDEPFLSFNMLEDDPSLYLSAVEQFCKSSFNIKNVISKAVFLKYSKVVQKTLQEDLLNPSDEIVKYFLSRPEIKTGNRITAQMIEKHRDITAVAMRKVFGIYIENSTSTPQNENDDTPAPAEQVKEKSITIETISKTIQEIASKNVPDFRCQTEDSNDFYKLHIYTTGSQKVGIIKITKSNLSIQFRQFANGTPVSYDLQRAEDFSKFLINA